MSETTPQDSDVAAEPQKLAAKEPDKTKRKPAAQKSTDKLAVQSPNVNGALFFTEHVNRTMIIYPIGEPEMRSLSILNGVTSAFFAIGTSVLTFCAGLYVDFDVAATATAPATKAAHLLYSALIPFGAICLVVAGIACYFRQSELTKILRESRGGK